MVLVWGFLARGNDGHTLVMVAINSITMLLLYGLSTGAALATVVGVLIEVPVMLMLVKFCLRTQKWFPQESSDVTEEPSISTA